MELGLENFEFQKKNNFFGKARQTISTSNGIVAVIGVY
jgi:hypothetical protein